MIGSDGDAYKRKCTVYQNGITLKFAFYQLLFNIQYTCAPLTLPYELWYALNSPQMQRYDSFKAKYQAKVHCQLTPTKISVSSM